MHSVDRDCDLLRAGLPGDLFPMGARFPEHIQTDPGAHSASYIVGTVSLLDVSVEWITHHLAQN